MMLKKEPSKKGVYNIQSDTRYDTQQNNPSQFTTTNYNYSKTSINFKNFSPSSTLPAFSSFKGFFNKKFNLTSYKKDRDDSRSRSKSPERVYQPHVPRGNGIPQNALERIIYLGNIFKKDSFQKYFEMRPQKKYNDFNKIIEYIINYRKNHSELESAMMAFYFVSHEVKYDMNYFDIKNDNHTEEQKNINYIKKIKNIKNSQKPEKVYTKGKALSLGFTNLFEYILKKMEIKYKHIEGYCKLLPHNNIIHPNHLINNNTNNISNLKININNINTNKTNKPKYSTRYNSEANNKRIKAIQISNNLIIRKKAENDEIKLPINHCWNAIYIRGEWYFVDALLASGGPISINPEDILKNINSPNDKKFCEDIDIYFNPFYFMPLPRYLIMTHRPSDDLWQFVDKIITAPQFISTSHPDISQFYRGVYQYNVELLTHQYPIIDINIKDNLKIVLRLKKAVLQSEIYDINSKTKISEVKYSFIEKKNIFIFEPSFPCNGDYLIKVKCRSLTSTDLIYWPLIDYVVKVHNKLATFSHFDKYKKNKTIENEKKNTQIISLPKITINSGNNTNLIHKPKIINDYSNFFPSKLNKKICYDNDGFFLIEPRIPYLKKGNLFKFKVIVKGANYVTLLDGNHWSNLKKTDKDTFEGEKNIKTDNVSICCLKGKNIFTEVYKFKFAKEKSLDTKNFMAKLMKNKSKINSII